MRGEIVSSYGKQLSMGQGLSTDDNFISHVTKLKLVDEVLICPMARCHLSVRVLMIPIYTSLFVRTVDAKN
jgi:hypothetical protein